MVEEAEFPMAKRNPTSEWTPKDHIAEACRLLDVTRGITGSRATGNAPVGLIEALVHAQVAQAKSMAVRS